MLRVFKYLVVFIAFLIILFFGASIIITKFYSDQLKELALIKLNEHLETPIYVNEISVSAFSQFPLISLKLEDFYLEDIKLLQTLIGIKMKLPIQKIKTMALLAYLKMF